MPDFPEPVPDFLNHPLPQDVLPRRIVCTQDAHALAVAMLPWARRNRRFTLMCALRLAGLANKDIGRRPRLTDKVQIAIRLLGCVQDGSTDWGRPIYVHSGATDVLPLGPTRVTCSGYTERDEKPPQDFQVQVARAWLREHARPTADIRRRLSSDGLRRLASAWTEATGAYADVWQENEHTGERYQDKRVYISAGAFIQAALDEGYRARRVGLGCDAHFDLAYRKTGAKWQGRAPTFHLAVRAGEDGRRLDAIIPPDEVRAKLVKFLDERKEFAFEINQPPLFQLKQAARACGMKYKTGTPPQVLVDTLRDLGCGNHKQYVKGGGEMRFWYRKRTCRRAGRRTPIPNERRGSPRPWQRPRTRHRASSRPPHRAPGSLAGCTAFVCR